MNSLKHGLTANEIVIGAEDPNQFEALRAGLEADFDPKTSIELELVDRLAGPLWRLRRMPMLEAAVIDTRYRAVKRFARSEGTDGALILWSTEHDALGKLSRYETGLMHAVTRTMNLLHYFRASRGEAESNEPIIETVAMPPDDASE